MLNSKPINGSKDTMFILDQEEFRWHEASRWIWESNWGFAVCWKCKCLLVKQLALGLRLKHSIGQYPFQSQTVLLSLLFVLKGLNWPMHFLTQGDTIQLISGWNPRPEHFNSLNDHKLYILFALKYWLWLSPEASQGHLFKIIHFRVDVFLSHFIN